MTLVQKASWIVAGTFSILTLAGAAGAMLFVIGAAIWHLLN